MQTTIGHKNILVQCIFAQEMLLSVSLCGRCVTSKISKTQAHTSHVTEIKQHIQGSWDSSVVRAPDSWLKGCEFKSLLERWEISFSRVNFLCWLLFQYLFHPCVNAVARKRPQSFCQQGRLQLNTHTPYVCGFACSNMVYGCMVYTECAKTAAVSCGASHASAVSPPLWWIFKKRAIKS